MPKKTKKYFLAGGGSGGSVAPMLALASALKKKLPDHEPLLVGTGDPEARMAKAEGIKVLHITAGKYRRYFSFQNILSPLWVAIGFLQSWVLIRRYKPEFIFGTGSFIQVPVMWAGWLLGVPVFLHQQDYIPSLANKLCALFATKITVTFEKSLQDYAQGWTLEHAKDSQKVIVTGNPVRKLPQLDQAKCIRQLKLNPDYPTLLITGGGTGAYGLNTLIFESLPGLVNIANVIHLTGVGKGTLINHPRYKQLEFSDDMGLLYSAADLVLCRAGIGTLSELAAFHKPAIVVPMPLTHQEYNAEYVAKHEAVLSVAQATLTRSTLVMLVRSVFFDYKLQTELARNIAKLMPAKADIAIAQIIQHNIAK